MFTSARYRRLRFQETAPGILAFLALVLAAVGSPVRAQDATPLAFEPEVTSPQPTFLSEASGCSRSSDCQPLQILFGYRTWFSWGHGSVSMAGTGGYPDILSELRWTRLYNAVQDFNLESVWWDRLILRAGVGVGTTGTGQLRDTDYDDNGRTAMFSDTQHPADAGDLAYLNLEVGWRCCSVGGPQARFTTDVLLGYQFWQEKYVAHGGTSLYPDTMPFPDGKVISNEFRWNSFLIGGRLGLELADRWTLGSRLMLAPTSLFQNRDVHFLRTDVLQDPSYFDQATGGFGVMCDATVGYRVWRGLSVELGYRLWELEGGLGQTTARTTDGDILSPLHRVQSLRQGVLVGLQYRF